MEDSMPRWSNVPGEAPAKEISRERPGFAELSIVSIRHPVLVDGQTLPSGTKGTVVAAYADGVGYEIEVFEPFHAVITLEAGDLAA
jgi:hypothetical protein